ncbi:winged helix DNA-binding domain-containing protein [Pendulispora rubella]|uniref:Winged helix DNA-binding domain-containing protein n=1 Tax=Pendulispora rubella TaxID=2741070 RepID=A0ABZ2LEA2_9BACT
MEVTPCNLWYDGRDMLALSARQARHLHLAAQGLLVPPRGRAKKADVLAAIARMQLLQIDTIHVVARSPYLVLFSRLGDYQPGWLEALLAEGAIFETWAHEACFAPIADYALHRRHVDGRNHWARRQAQRMHDDHREAMDRLLAHVRELGPVKSSDFERNDKGGEKRWWWGWKSEKRWLEALFVLGELMIARRDKFQRVYDLTERVLAAAAPDVDPTVSPSEEEMRRTFIVRAVRALGVTQARWIADYFRLGRRLKDVELDPFVESGDIVRVEVEGWGNPGYMHAAHTELVQSPLRATHSTLLSPFDPVVWDRERATGMFDFDYRIECYVPAEKRQYGYFVLPILRRGALVGRLDAKAHRVDGIFEIKSVYLQPGQRPTEALTRDVAEAIRTCAAWHRTPKVQIRKSDPRPWAKSLRAALAAPSARKRKGADLDEGE